MTKSDAGVEARRQPGRHGSIRTMPQSDVLPINFTISPAAKREIEIVRAFWDSESSDPAAVAVIAWGLYRFNSGQERGTVVVTFYGRSQLPEVADMVQDVSGLKVVFLTTEEHHPRFNGKIVDHAADRGFFLREP
jgi:hypothetical protein